MTTSAETRTMPELLPCPFCGALPVTVHAQGHETYIDCKTPFCAAEGICVPTAEAWNRRASLLASVPSEREVIERCAKVCDEQAQRWDYEATFQGKSLDSQETCRMRGRAVRIAAGAIRALVAAQPQREGEGK